MKKITLSTIRSAFWLGPACALLASAPLLHAEGNNAGFYIGTDAGVNIMEDVTLPGVAASVSTDPGLRWSLEAGYGFRLSDKLTLGAEVETGILYNSLSKASVSGFSVPLGGDYYQVPVLANLVLTFRAGKWVPYVGFGGGFAYSSVSINSVGSIPVSGFGDETDPAFQAMAGLRYQISDHTDIGLGYKYLAVFPSNINSVGNHAISASFTCRF